MDILDEEEEVDEVENDEDENEEEEEDNEDVEVSIVVSDIVENGSDMLRCCLWSLSVVVASMMIRVAYIGRVDFTGVGVVRFVVCTVSCVSVSTCYCEVC